MMDTSTPSTSRTSHPSDHESYQTTSWGSPNCGTPKVPSPRLSPERALGSLGSGGQGGEAVTSRSHSNTSNIGRNTKERVRVNVTLINPAGIDERWVQVEYGPDDKLIDMPTARSHVAEGLTGYSRYIGLKITNGFPGDDTKWVDTWIFGRDT